MVGETNTVRPISEPNGAAASHSSILRRSFASSRTHGTTNEKRPGKYSGSWLPTVRRFGKRHSMHLLPAFISAEAKTGSVCVSAFDGNLYPVTAAQLPPIHTEFLCAGRSNMARKEQGAGCGRGGGPWQARKHAFLGHSIAILAPQRQIHSGRIFRECLSHFGLSGAITSQTREVVFLLQAERTRSC